MTKNRGVNNRAGMENPPVYVAVCGGLYNHPSVPIPASRLWKDLPAETRVAAADAFWRDRDAGEQQAEAVVALARKLNFRAKSVMSLPIERRARHLAQLADVSDALAGRALVAYHFGNERPLMTAFLDALGIQHENGLIPTDELPAPDEAKLRAAVDQIRAEFPSRSVQLYLQTLVALDPETWTALDSLIPLTS
jgi:hypothetical protein